MDLINFRIGGTHFVLMHSNLRKYPNTLLGRFSKMEHEQRMDLCHGFFPSGDQYFFDRSAILFESIALLYRMDLLHPPIGFEPAIFKQELHFWEIDLADLPPECIWTKSPTQLAASRRKTLPYLNGMESWVVEDPFNAKPKDAVQVDPQEQWTDTMGALEDSYSMSLYARARRRVWLELNGNFRIFGKIVEFVSLMFIILTVIVLCMESYHDIRLQACLQPLYRLSNFSIKPDNISQSDITELNCQAETFTYLDLLDIICVSWFTLEFVVYLWAAPNRCAFLISPIGVIDAISVFPVYLECILKFSGALHVVLEKLSRTFLALRVLRSLRVVRILKIARYSRGLQVIGLVFRRSFQELLLVFIYTFILTVFFATLVYYAEFGTVNNKFDNIPVATWWAIVTLTTLGYGDIVPQTTLGKVIAAIATMSGVVLLAFPISIIVERFTVLYAEVVIPTSDRRRGSTIIKVKKIGKHVRVQRTKCPTSQDRHGSKSSTSTLLTRQSTVDSSCSSEESKRHTVSFLPDASSVTNLSGLT